MDEFVSTFTNRLDLKGRVSIPAPFRAVLAKDGFDGLYCCQTLDQQAVDAGGNLFRARIRELLSRYPEFSADHDSFSTVLSGDSEILKIDPDGRVILSDKIRDYAGVTDQVTFVGQIYKFQIWEPQRFIAYRDEAKARLRALRQAESSHRAGSASSGATG